NSPLPSRKQYGVTTTRDGQTDFELVVVQGDQPTVQQCEYLGTVKLTGLPAGPRGMAKIAVTFELGAECLLTVTAREMNTGKQVPAKRPTKDPPEAVRQKLAAGGPPASAPATPQAAATPA